MLFRSDQISTSSSGPTKVKDAVRGGGLKAVGLAPFAAWLKNDVAGYAMPFISAPVQALITQPYWWMGWGYPGAGPGCA